MKNYKNIIATQVLQLAISLVMSQQEEGLLNIIYWIMAGVSLLTIYTAIPKDEDEEEECEYEEESD